MKTGADVIPGLFKLININFSSPLLLHTLLAERVSVKSVIQHNQLEFLGSLFYQASNHITLSIDFGWSFSAISIIFDNFTVTIRETSILL